MPRSRLALEQRIASGSLADVYRASLRLSAGLSKPCVAKLISPEITREPGFLELLGREASLALQLSHPNVVSVLEVGQVSSRWFVALEQVEGCNLEAFAAAWWREQGRGVPAEVALYITRELLSGLEHCHQVARRCRGSLDGVHREISGANVLLSAEGGVKLADFGLSLSPSRLRRHPADPGGDLFCVGVLLFELLSGAAYPSDGNADALLPSGLPVRVRALVNRSVALQGGWRHRSAAELYSSVQRALAELAPGYGSRELAGLLGRQSAQRTGLSTLPTVIDDHASVWEAPTALHPRRQRRHVVIDLRKAGLVATASAEV